MIYATYDDIFIMLNELLIIILAYTGLSHACDTDIDPCTVPDTHLLMDDADRSLLFQPEGFQYVGDYELPLGWYRSISGAGGDMPTERVEAGNCSAVAPIWLVGELPEEADGIVTMMGCASDLEFDEGEPGPQCVREYEIPVRNCGDFRLYCLAPTIDSWDRYCMGDRLICPEGQSSETGFEPGCGEIDVVLEQDPFIVEDGVHFDQTTFFLCSASNRIACGVNQADIFMDVTWFVEGINIPIPMNDIEDQDAAAVPSAERAIITTNDLTAAGYGLGITLVCRVRPRSAPGGIPGVPRQTSFFIGVIPQETIFNLVEGGDPVQYVLDLTIPYVYRTPGNCEAFEEEEYLNNNDPATQLSVFVALPLQDEEPEEEGTCVEADAVVQLERDIGEDGCAVNANRRQIVVNITANANGNYNPNRDLAIQLRTPTSNDQNPFWANHSLPRAQAFIQDGEANALSGRNCRAYHDPHFVNFNQRYMRIQRSGYFIMYQHTVLPIRVEVFFQHYSSTFSLACGAAVRSGGEIFVYDRCVQSAPLYVSAYDCDQQDLDIVRHSSNRYDIILPTGTMVRIDHRSVTVIPSMLDVGLTEGLCGRLNDVSSVEDDMFFHNDDGTTTSTSDVNLFSDRWRAPADESLYFGVIHDHRTFNDVSFCGCSGDNTNPGAQCSSQSQVRYCLDRNHPLVSEKTKRCNSVARRRRRDVHVQRRKRRQTIDTTNEIEDERVFFEFDPDFIGESASWGGEWTLESATAECDTRIRNTAIAESCASVAGVNLEGVIEDCILDIQLSGTSDFTSAHYNTMLSLCETELVRNVYTTTNSTRLAEQNAIIAVLNNICPNDCSNHGTCSNGVCSCDNGYTDTDCGVNYNHVPVLFDLPFGGLCDVNTRICADFPVFGDLFVEVQNITCRLVFKDENGDELSEPIYEMAEVEHFQKVICPISPDIFTDEGLALPHIVEIAVSNNNEDYSDPKELIVYDGRCWNCSSGNCLQKEQTCVDDGICYENEEQHFDQTCLACNGVSQNIEIQDDQCFIDNQCFVAGTLNPVDENQRCDPTNEQLAWSEVQSPAPTHTATSEEVSMPTNQASSGASQMTVDPTDAASPSAPTASQTDNADPSTDAMQRPSSLPTENPTNAAGLSTDALLPSANPSQSPTDVAGLSSTDALLASTVLASQPPSDVPSSEPTPTPELINSASDIPSSTGVVSLLPGSTNAPGSVMPTDSSDTGRTTDEGMIGEQAEQGGSNSGSNKKGDNDNMMIIAIVIPIVVVALVAIIVGIVVVKKLSSNRTAERTEIRKNNYATINEGPSRANSFTSMRQRTSDNGFPQSTSVSGPIVCAAPSGVNPPKEAQSAKADPNSGTHNNATTSAPPKATALTAADLAHLNKWKQTGNNAEKGGLGNPNYKTERETQSRPASGRSVSSTGSGMRQDHYNRHGFAASSRLTEALKGYQG